MGLNWFLSQHILMDKYQCLHQMLRQENGILYIVIKVVMVVLEQGIRNPMTWGGIHLLQAGEPGQMETASVN